jgi:hypothetical protein
MRPSALLRLRIVLSKRRADGEITEKGDVQTQYRPTRLTRSSANTPPCRSDIVQRLPGIQPSQPKQTAKELMSHLSPIETGEVASAS